MARTVGWLESKALLQRVAREAVSPPATLVGCPMPYELTSGEAVESIPHSAADAR